LPLSARGYFVFMGEEVTPDEPDSRPHTGKIGAQDELRCGGEEIEGDNQHGRAKQRDRETYCQRSDHAITLAQHRIENDDQGSKCGTDSKARRRCPLNLVRKRLPEDGPGSKGASREASCDYERPRNVDIASTNTPASGMKSNPGQSTPRP
jgi:hypothetical protein